MRLMFFSLLITSHAWAGPICHTSTPDQNKTSDLLQMVSNTSEYISSATGLFDHFEYNRLFRTQMGARVSCVSLVKVGLRDFGNGNTYGDYFIQVSYSEPTATTPSYVLSALYRAGSVQSFEGLEIKPWYDLDRKQVAHLFESRIEASVFSPTARDDADPVAVAQKFVGSTYDGQGVTYTPLYVSLPGRYFLVTWENREQNTYSHQGLLIRVDESGVATAPWDDISTGLELPLDQIRAASDPTQNGAVDVDRDALVQKALDLSRN